MRYVLQLCVGFLGWALLVCPAASGGDELAARLLALGDSTATIAWDTRVPQVGRVRVVPDGGGVGNVMTLPTGLHHRAMLNGLAAGTRYGYQIAYNGRWTPARHFKTFLRDFQQTLRFAVIGDSGSGSTHQWALARRLAAWQPDFVLHAGDVIYETGAADAYAARYVAPYRDLIARVPVYPVLGNHDYRSAQGEPFLQFFGLDAGFQQRWYERRMGGFQVLACDSNQSMAPGSPQYRWLNDRLASGSLPWRIVMLHHPLHSSGMHGGSAILRRHLEPLLVRYRVRLVIQGHDHHYERVVVPREGGAGTTYLVTGGAGAWLRRTSRGPHTVQAFSAYHFVGFTLDDDGLHGVVLDDSGTVRDAFVPGVP